MSDRWGASGEPATRRLGEPDAVELLADPDRPRAGRCWSAAPRSPTSTSTIRGTSTSSTSGGSATCWTWPRRTPSRCGCCTSAAAALSLARYVAATRPGSSQLAVDATRRGGPGPGTAAAAPASRRPAARPARIRVRIGDARAVLEKLPAGSFDVVIADLFAGARTPAHLTSVEFAAAARAGR